MTTLLHLDSSANRSGESLSRQLSALFAEAWRAEHGCAGYCYRDLATDPVPPLTTAFCQLGRRAERVGRVPFAEIDGLLESPAEKHEWEITRPLIAEILAADTILIGAPMYNFSVSALLKAWIDRVTLPGVFEEAGTGQSLLRDTKVVVTGACGGSYGPGTDREGYDFQLPYLRAYFGKQGVPAENVSFARAEMTLSELVPQYGRYRPMAAASFETARADVLALAGDVV